ncbi:MAG TPA: glycoside hydrolase family 5 protein, partial [Mobilitalea sp.]|nr:glycoside hydrolase family 5 protein [Mobilitalea sp.]
MRKKGYFLLVLICLLIGLTYISCTKKQNIAVENEYTSEYDYFKDDESNDEEANEELNETADEDIKKDKNADEESSLSIRDIPSVELIKEFSIGWNLGNTLDATGSSLLSSEVSWGNPYTKKEVFDAVKDAGFNIVRIPVSWGKHLGPAPDYKIHEEWLDRVNEVVDYAIDNDLYVIINMHHEEWHFPSYENFENANVILTSVWTQIAERFKDYDEHLIFEGMNEPRMKGTPFEWTGGNAEARDVVNKLNQSFVETIRASGGNNPYRHLMIPTYAASADPKTWTDFIIPDDEKVIVSIHAYTPYNFALNKNGTSVWSPDNPSDTDEIDNLINNIYEYFISNGHAVIIGEFGAMDKNNLQDRVNWARYYVQKATEKGIPCIWWDNGAFTGSGELFGLLDR